MVEAINRRQSILEAALRVFSVHGFHKASIKLIAKEANIKSSALIYHYFADKKDVLTAIIHELSPAKDLPLLNDEQMSQLMDLPLEQVLPLLLERIIAMQDDPTIEQLLRIYFSEAVRTPEVADAVGDLQMLGLGLLTKYLNRQIELGRLRSHNVQVTARAIVGTILVYFMTGKVFQRLSESLPEREVYIEEITKIFLDGVGKERS